MSETPHLPSEPEPPNQPDPPQLNPLTRWCTHHNFNPFADPIDSRSSDGDFFSDAASDSDRDVSCFVTDLFDRRASSDHHPPSDCVLVSGSDSFSTELEIEGDDGDDLGSNSNLGLGFGAESNSQGSGSEFGDFLAPQGLRVVGLESDSDSDNDEFESNRVSEGIQSIWDSIFMEEQRNAYENSEWEEVEQRIELPDSSIEGGGVEELSVASGFSTEEEEVPEGAARSIEWEILLTVNNFRRNVDDVELDIETAEYIEEIFGQFVENANACKGSPPAALRAVEDLPFVEFSVEELSKEEVVCAVCKDDIVLEDKVRSLPCCHYYHQDCIVPWLSIRNTCPVCRYELPTDDLDYERSKCERAARGLSWESQVRLDFERFV
ncbi:putative aminoacyltransferase, E1 ubiquitin-activating enzyme [Rosa chinensis]|uniref:RING-type E3 ubiquitin transferase n=1 Tax=Rosa chinensis TaxID=74649 RepID=A0A2P6S3G9_ROSCH|nr:E3 ubiquitin-protein ligase CIP8 [Rosa chinensis]PRQ53233.1 putative aminoacyltransferase, E1 ubiquitin-activating enzyme [Rosa chinensis]